MKKYTNIFSYMALAAVVFFTACNPNEEIYDELDAVDTGYEKNIEVTLSSSDYQDIADMAFDNATTPEDSSAAAFIDANQYFTDDILAADYVPYYLESTYGSYGLNSSAEVSFNYNANLPEDFDQYTMAEEYELTSADYNLVGFEVGATKYFFPDKPASVYLEDVLNETINNAQEEDILLISYEQSNVNPTIDTTSAQDIPIYQEGFPEEGDLGSFTDINISGDQTWYWQEYGDGCATMSGFDGGNVPNENLLVSEAISLEDVEEAKLNFSQAVNYMDDQYWDQLQVLVTDDYNPDSPVDSPWDELTVPNWPPGNGWSFYESGDIDLTNYAGSTIHIAFFYTSSADNACTWEVGQVDVLTPGEASITGEEPYTVETFYNYDGDTWSPVEDVYYLNAQDYDQMGAPGNYNNFSASDLPKDYLPKFVDYKYPLAGEDVSKTIVYKFYNGSSTVSLATTFTVEDGEWTSSYNYIDETTQRFLVAEKRGNWIFDPTVRFTMNSSDHQIIVEAVRSEIGSEYVDSYGTGEYYTGASSYYANFDLRIGPREDYDPETFEGLSEEEANNEIIRRLLTGMELLLQNKYPDAEPRVSGVDVHYIVTFESYNHDFSRSTWVADMQCVEAGNPPQFDLVDNTFIKDGDPVPVPE
jgi:hypothetical protein